MNRIYQYILYVLLVGMFVSMPLSESQADPYTILYQKGFFDVDNGNQVAVCTTLSHPDQSATDDEHYRHLEDVCRDPGRAYKRGYRDGYREGVTEWKISRLPALGRRTLTEVYQYWRSL